MNPPSDRRVALVTGAGRGIGRAIALELSAQGCTVIAVDVMADSAQDTAAACGGASWGVGVDVADSGAVDQLVAQGV
jgi:NAD(P)-dependent dehydrogenase (short-subunit alcohol dehydrogenase family)